MCFTLATLGLQSKSKPYQRHWDPLLLTATPPLWLYGFALLSPDKFPCRLFGPSLACLSGLPHHTCLSFSTWFTLSGVTFFSPVSLNLKELLFCLTQLSTPSNSSSAPPEGVCVDSATARPQGFQVLVGHFLLDPPNLLQDPDGQSIFSFTFCRRTHESVD